jgi:phosphate transport system permease protein
MTLYRRITDYLAGHVMLLTSLFAGVLVLLIGGALLARSWPLLRSQGILHVFLGTDWSPSAGQFGLKAFILGTLAVTGLSAVLAVPVCLLATLYLAEYATPRMRAVVKPFIDLLAGIPSVVYGVWGVLVVVPFLADRLAPYAASHWQHVPGLATVYSTGFSVLAGAIVLAVMIAPSIIAIADEVVQAVPAEMREASYALGATRLETITRVVMRRALPGLVAAVVLGVSRALGETMAVLMVVGNVPLVPHSIFDPAYPLPALIANNYGEMMSIPLYDSALLSAALFLLLVVLAFNVLARLVLVQAMRKAA